MNSSNSKSNRPHGAPKRPLFRLPRREAKAGERRDREPPRRTLLLGRAANGEGCLRARIGAYCAAAFTLVELLTVIAVIAVLASLLMTAIASAKKKSRTAVCTFNLHQISLALNMYLDDFGTRPQRVDDLVNGKYLPGSRTLLCPEDKTGNWGQLVQSANSVVIGPQFGAPPVAGNESVKYSYLLHPLSVDQATWDRLMRAGETAGVAACQLHGLGTQDVADVHSFSGLLLRAQKDGAVVRRRLFWTSEVPPPIGAVASGFNTTSSSSDFYSLQIFPVQIYLDDPTHWSESP
jgi:prepilin-type N-terminal cleavage/methylation domain-containing protein